MNTKSAKKITYVAFLRGINVGGNFIIKMTDLQKTFEKMGFRQVRTYIQSGNVIFQTDAADPRALEEKIQKALAKKYAPYKAKIVVRSLKEMSAVITYLPKEWAESDMKYNVIFLRHTVDSKKFFDGLSPKKGIEWLSYKPGVLYWSARTSDLSQTTLVKLSSQKIYQDVTVRNLNTTKKIFELMKEIDEQN